jgi:DNA-binding LacI/PurR family transcriptional regulator
MKTLNEYGINRPKKVVLLEIDDIDTFSYMHPGLTTIHIPKREIGARSAKRLLDVMNSSNKAEDDDKRRIAEKEKLWGRLFFYPDS